MNDNSPAYTTEYIADSAHYEKVIASVAGVKRQLWIGTADIKDLYVAQGRQTVPFLAIIAGLIKKGVEIRLIHAKEPGQAFREDFDRYPELATGLERILCPRVHFKLLIFDMKTAYIGSANLTGAGIGMKSPLRRNFEAGILTDDPALVEAAANRPDNTGHEVFLRCPAYSSDALCLLSNICILTTCRTLHILPQNRLFTLSPANTYFQKLWISNTYLNATC